MSNFKGSQWFDRYCEMAGLTGLSRYQLPSEVIRHYEEFGYLWKAHVIEHYHKRSLVLLICADHRASHGKPLAYWDPDKDNIYRVCIDPLTQRVEVTHFGIDCLDTPEVGMYADTSTLPIWIQERLAVLSMVSSKPPTTPVEGVGQRINASTYWLPKYT